MYRTCTIVFIASVSLAPHLGHAGQPAAPCYNIGESVTVRGRVSSAFVNGGTDLQLVDIVCVHYPAQKDRRDVGQLTTMGRNVQPGRFYEVVGKLREIYPIVGVGIEIGSIRDVDSEVKAAKRVVREQCEAWQHENAPKLKEQAHGATVVFSPQNERTEDFEHSCGIWAVDKDLPHELVTIRRPTQRQ
jgi:hypothetical protein